MLISIVIRTYNEEKYLGELLKAINTQESSEIEVVLVDSGSTDNTLSIAKDYDCKIIKIAKSDFTFGYSLNVGCNAALGEVLVFISGHCIPRNSKWLVNLVSPIVDQNIDYVYGRQIGRDFTKFSEGVHFEKTFPKYSKIPQDGFFCNNANAALKKSVWQKFRFNEELTGLEDMFLAKKIFEIGGQIGYVSDASVFHIHDESWSQVKKRYEREAYALQKILPEVHFNIGDAFRYFFSGVFSDFSKALDDNILLSKVVEIVRFRYAMYSGTYKGNHQHRQLSKMTKMQYFYPKDLERHNYE